MSSNHFDPQQIIGGDVQQMSQLFAAAALAAVRPAEGNDSARQEICPDLETLIRLIKDVEARDVQFKELQYKSLESLKSALPAHSFIEPALHLRLETAENLFNRIFGEQQLDPVLQKDLAPLLMPFLYLCAGDDSIYCNPKHPARRLLAEILARASSWYPRDSKPSQAHHEKLQQLISASHAAWTATATAASLEQALADFQVWAANEDKRAHLLEERLCESELAGMKLLAAECSVVELINHALAGKLLPLTITEQIPLLKSELQHCLINEGSTSSFWKVWQRTLPLVGRVFSNGEDPVDEQQLYRDIPLALAELEHSAHRDRVAADQYHDFIDSLTHTLMQTIQKQKLECSLWPALPYPTGYTDSHTRVTEAILQQGKTFAPGDWILFRGEDDQIIRCKLALKIPDSEHMLFVDRSGRKVMVKSSKDFSLCLSTGVAERMEITTVDNAVEQAIAELIVHGDVYAEQLQREKNQKLKLLQAAKHLAAEKALNEARKLAEQKRQRELAAKGLEEKVMQQQKAMRAAEKVARAKAAQILAESLNVGAWIEITGVSTHVADETPTKLRCKLSVIIGASGKYIFVDQVGRKAAEYQREHLVQEINDEKIKVISKGDKFEDQLVKVIRGLRKDIS